MAIRMPPCDTEQSRWPGAEQRGLERAMRLMLKFTIPVEKGNAAAENGTIDKAIEALVERVKPEAGYFFLENGRRAGLVIFEEIDQARLPAINEPLFAALDASIEIQPVLSLADLERGLHRRA